MLFEPAAFHHCLAAGGCVVPHASAPPGCLRGERVAFLGDSVVEGTFIDVWHMWAQAQREVDGAPVNKLAGGYCQFDQRSKKWSDRGRKRFLPAVNVSACTAPESAGAAADGDRAAAAATAAETAAETAAAASGSAQRRCGWFTRSDCLAADEAHLAVYPQPHARGNASMNKADARMGGSKAERRAAHERAIAASKAQRTQREAAGRVCDGAQVEFALGDFRLPFRHGMSNYLRHWERVLAHLRTSTVLVLESGRHDLANIIAGLKSHCRTGGGCTNKRRVLGKYRASAGEVAAKLRHAIDSEHLKVRVVFRTMLPPPSLGTCAIAANLESVAAIANAAAAHAFASNGFEVLPLHVWGRAAHHPQWWPSAVYADSADKGSLATVRDVHTHEGWCPRARIPSADTPAVEQLGHRYGWLSKALTQLSAHALCWPAGTLNGDWPGPPPLAPPRSGLPTRRVGAVSSREGVISISTNTEPPVYTL
mmetsp:Transcript_48472/g.113414  ORF Transcript_48472/g.113414 Transcript_48472/m.113414 type:complete len:481 (-) Transcript_48472:31-1473(-)